MRTHLALAILIVIALCAEASRAQSNVTATDIDAYLQPYVRSGNFAGDVLIKKDGKVVFEKAYGLADLERRISNTPATRFHIASVSMQFTAAAVLRLVDTGAIKLDDHVGDIVPGLPGADKITVRHLLTERSGLPDINALPAYNEILQHHQTPESLVVQIKGKPLLFEPGTKFLHEEHSAYNVLALIVEKKTNLPFAAAVERLVFRSAGLAASAVDDDSAAHALHVARGYEPEGTYGLKPAASIHWSAKTGNASVYTTAGDEARWVAASFQGHLLSATSREAVLDTSQKVGYGWLRSENQRFGETTYYMNGRAPGFASFVLYLPRAQMTVVVLSNIYSSATTTIGYDVAALSLGLPHEPFRFRDPAPTAAELKTCAGHFQFGADFFQPNAEVALIASDRELSMRWPTGELSPLIPVGPDHFVDRSYWEDVVIKRDSSGKPSALVYDRFEGKSTGPK
jgi:CubicO group peptidase (beta-lactamase class C family)